MTNANSKRTKPAATPESKPATAAKAKTKPDRKPTPKAEKTAIAPTEPETIQAQVVQPQDPNAIRVVDSDLMKVDVDPRVAGRLAIGLVVGLVATIGEALTSNKHQS